MFRQCEQRSYNLNFNLYTVTRFLLHIADNTLVLGHRNSEWTGHGPALEQDIALSNIALDLIGQARHAYQYAADLTGGNTTEDSLAYFRGPEEFLNCLLVEQANGDWGKTLMRQFLFSAYQYPFYEALQQHYDGRVAAIASKSLKEVTYHLRWSSEWVIRLGQGTEESHNRMQAALQQLWMFTAELYTPAVYEEGFADAHLLQQKWSERVHDIFSKSGLAPDANIQMRSGGKQGRHTACLEQLLEEMQYMQRTYPGLEW